MAEALCRLYKDVTGRVGQHLLYGSARPGCPGALAAALLALTQGLKTARIGMRYLLVQFNCIAIGVLDHHATAPAWTLNVSTTCVMV